MAKKVSAYLLPEVPNPPEDRCLIVFVPDDIAYLRAVTGSLMHLEKWVAWERDEAHTALVAAERMKQANQRTLETMAVTDCEFLQELIEDGDMSINITNNTSCGSCGAGAGACGCGPTITPDPLNVPPAVTTETETLPEQEFDGENPPEGFTDLETYLAHKCRASRELARDIIQTIGNFGTLSGVVAALGAYAIGLLITAPSSAFVASLLLPLIGVGLSPVAAIAIVGSLLMFLIVSSAGLLVYFNTLEAQLAIRIDDLTCALYTANSGQEARANMLNLIDEEVLNLIFDDAGDEEIFNRTITKILETILAPDIFKILFATGAAIADWLSERDDGFDCSICTPPTLGEWIWTYSSGYSGTSVVTVTANNPTTFHVNGQIHRGSQFGAYEFALTHPLDGSVTRVEFSLNKIAGDAIRITSAGVPNISNNAPNGTYLIAEEAQPDAGNFDHVFVVPIGTTLRFSFSTVYSSSAPRPLDWQIDNWAFS